MLEVSKELEYDTYQDYPIEERFLKLPAKSYLDLLNIEPCRPQFAILNAVNDPRYRFITACVSRRVGKTYISNIICQLVALTPGTTVLIIAPDYSLASISWDLQRQLLDMFDIERVRDNAKDRIIELATGSMIRIASVSRVDSAVGRSYDLIIFDEAALNDDGGKAFNISLRPTLDKINSKCIFISTPRGDNWFKEFYDRGWSDLDEHREWISIHADYHENPRASARDIASAKSNMSNAEFQQEYLANFVTFEGQIWSLDPDQIGDYTEVIERVINNRDSLSVIAGLDLGFKDPTALSIIACIYEEEQLNYYIIDEYMQSGTDTAVHAREIQRMIDMYDMDFIFVDPASAQTVYDLSAIYDIGTIKALKSITHGIGFVSAAVDHNRIFVHQDCVENIYALRNYKWKENVDRETPEHNRASHMADAIRYAIYSYGMVNG